MKKRRILLALIMLIISGISLTTATYAWFTSNRAVKVDEIDISAQASGGIQISADALTWSNQVTLEQLKAEATTYIPTTSLMPVTTVGVNGGTGAFDFYIGELNDAGDKVTLTKTTDDENKYVSFDLYFYSATPQTVIFDAGTQVAVKNVTGGEGSSAKDAGLKSSVRVGFLHQGVDATATQATAKALNGGVLANQIIWEPNADKHTDFAVSQLGATADTVLATMGGKAAAATAVATDASTHFETITTAHNLKTSTVTQVYPEGTLWNFEAGINKVRVYVWIEGQDIDNEDSASLGSGVGVKLNFKIPDKTA